MSIVEFFVGGGADKGDFGARLTGPSNIMKQVKEHREKKAPHIICEYRGHENYDAILEEIREKWRLTEYTSIRLTGHSWGGRAAMRLAQELGRFSIPVDELITLDPVSLLPISRGQMLAAKWVNVFIRQSFIDKTVGKIPIVGNVINAIVTLPTAVTAIDNYVANIGGQLGYEHGAHNIEMDVRHRDAKAMYDRARIEIINAQAHPKVIGVR